MLEYGIRQITTNPTLITRSKEIIKIVDNKQKKTKAYIVPSRYESYVKKMIKELEFRKWVEDKKQKLLACKNEEDDDLSDFSKIGLVDVERYLDEEK